MKEFPFDQIDPQCSVGANLDHTLYVFEGYRTCVLGDEDYYEEYSPYSPGSARDVSWKIGYKQAMKDLAKQ